MRDGLKGESGAHVVPDYRGIPVLSVYSPVDFGGQKWVLLAEIDETEILAQDEQWFVLVVAVIAGLAAAGLALVVHKLTSSKRQPQVESAAAS